MSVLALSRLQFGVTAAFHFIFVPLTLGLSLLVAWMETRYVRTGDELYLRMARFWGRLFLINFALGVVTGITLEFQFGMNWAAYSRYVGDIFGVPLAIEATAAFFLESVFIGLWAFGWGKVSKKVHLLAIWLVAIASTLSAFWILMANGWMQRPVGFVLRNGRAELSDLGAFLTNSAGWVTFAHTTLSGYVLGALFVMGVSAHHLLRRSQVPFFRTSFRMAAVFGLVSAVLVAAVGDQNGVMVAERQPAKLAALESFWESRSNAPFTIFLWPDPKNEKNAFEFLSIPSGLSLMAFHRAGAEVKGLREFQPGERPPVLPVFLGFRIMVGLGIVFIILTFLGWRKGRRGRLESSPAYLKILLYGIPLPYIAVQAGWLVTEVGRQPWIVYGVMKTSEGLSGSLQPGQVIASLVGFTIIYGLLAAVDIYLLARYSRANPEEIQLGAGQEPRKAEA
ncbi:MAG: cytochrome D ubiquinol oxidase subunit I [Candidatus Aminicenantes bacterium RBG_16_63_16]|nr:MAG: cytochrome D ubiquinol oxidase subunit I [Candidatus Aminicenantes bacterium RBG_16_63_16]